MGQLFSESGYEVTFVDVDRPLLDALNGRGRYTIPRLVTNEQHGRSDGRPGPHASTPATWTRWPRP